MWPLGHGTGGVGSPGGGSERGPSRARGEGSSGAEDNRRGSWPGGGRREGGCGPGSPPAGSGAKGQAEGSARGAGAAARVTAARPSHPQFGRGGRGRLGPPPAVCISLAGGGAWVERNRLHLERCLFFLTSPAPTDDPRARRPDPPSPRWEGVRTGGGPTRRALQAPPGNAPGYPSAWVGGRVAVGQRNDFLSRRKTYFFLSQLLSFDLARGGAAKWLSFPLWRPAALGFSSASSIFSSMTLSK